MVDHELDELRKEFLAEAREKVKEMESAASAPRAPETLERLAYLAHQLKGSGGSYGFQAISENAAELEKTIEKAGDDPAPEISEQIVVLLDEIDRCEREM